MDSTAAKNLQIQLQQLGFYKGKIDGQWGPGSQAAYDAAKAGGALVENTQNLSIAWSAKVSPAFVQRVIQGCKDLQMDDDGPNKLMSCMAWETGETFSPTIKNGAGAPYYGLIQFGKAACDDIGTTIEKILLMSAEEQLDCVFKFFKPYTGKLHTISDIYARIIWPAAVGKPEDYVIFDENNSPTTYHQNRGIDLNSDGKCTKAEAAQCVLNKYNKGMSAIYRASV